MISSWRDENRRTLIGLLGLDLESAEKLLDASVAISASRSRTARGIAKDLQRLLGRTVRAVGPPEALGGAPDVEVVVGSAAARTDAPRVTVDLADGIRVTTSSATPSKDSDVAPIFQLIAACYAAGTVIRLLAGRSFPFGYSDPIIIRPDEIAPETDFDGEASAALVDVYLAGAGAVGNGFVLGLSKFKFKVEGNLHIVDPDVVDDGNLNRNLLMGPGDVGFGKAVRLCENSRALLPGVILRPTKGTLQEHSNRNEGAWLRTLVSAVDSRRARRRLQEELPRQVLDASTTGIEEVVLTFNDFRMTRACMSCIYRHDEAEASHERHVADLLGVDESDVREHLVSGRAAKLIAARYPHLSPQELEGAAYDSLFKQLCGAGQLTRPSEGRVLAPLAFVSVLAGAYLALEFVRRTLTGDFVEPYSYWRISPWASPVVGLRRRRLARPDCPHCGSEQIREAVGELWVVECL